MTSEAPPLYRPSIRAWLPPAIALLILVAFIVLLAAIARATRDDPLPPVPGPFVPPASAHPSISYAVERAGGDGVLTLSRGQDNSREQVTMTLPVNSAVDVLEPADPSAIEPGDWLTVIGVKNEVRNFAVRMIVLVDGGGTPSADGWLRTPSGFVGHEAASESGEVPILTGRVTSVSGSEIVLESATSVVVTVNPGGPLRRLRSGTVADITGGDRLALHEAADETPDLSLGALVVTGE